MNHVEMPVARSASLSFQADMSLAGRNRLAVADIRDGLRLWRLAWALGWLDIRLRYRGSVLGPLWLTISTGVMVGALGFLYSTLFKMELHDYLPYLALSLVLWAFMQATVSDACTGFTEAESVIRSVRMPFTVVAIRTVIRNVVILGHNIVVIVIVFAVFNHWPGYKVVFAIPGVLLWVVNALALNLMLGAFCARFRDILPIINSVMQIAFFLTPIIWKPEQLGEKAWLLPLSPFFDLIEIVRAPLLGQVPSVWAWVGALAYSAALCTVSWMFFARARGRIAFWL